MITWACFSNIFAIGNKCIPHGTSLPRSAETQLSWNSWHLRETAIGPSNALTGSFCLRVGPLDARQPRTDEGKPAEGQKSATTVEGTLLPGEWALGGVTGWFRVA